MVSRMQNYFACLQKEVDIRLVFGAGRLARLVRAKELEERGHEAARAQASVRQEEEVVVRLPAAPRYKNEMETGWSARNMTHDGRSNVRDAPRGNLYLFVATLLWRALNLSQSCSLSSSRNASNCRFLYYSYNKMPNIIKPTKLNKFNKFNPYWILMN